MTKEVPRRPRVIGVNGILTHGSTTTDRLLKRLRDMGHPTRDIHLPKRSWISARWGARDDAREIVRQSRHGDVIVAHSFGCLRAAMAMQERDYQAVFMFRPAMSRHFRFKHPMRVHCFHTTDDLAILLGQFLLLHPFGGAGRKGFTQEGVRNYPAKGSHSADFQGSALSFHARYIHSVIK